MTFYRYNNHSKYSRNTRIGNLLGFVELSERIYRNIIDMIFNDSVYDNVDIRLVYYRNFSLKFLEKELSLAGKK